ncbi:hypothetical protein BJF93_17485 [Xaviernesmea oryzae]|uniref:Intersectin-EH binding protein Ibp1 n=1 Tax=Xaviernesmea oryzae TaxID=464029 RepID=A0A1Q9ATG7_9HYPH|nr:hypothetical protein [Xaviernesmea oryzae]OLP58631.1 hypothetical protein BJF93_17485 [Xaviernesmea oryzae]SEK64966.1 hypothetical protein SAMN04487976_103204 [Xaviernesmea oryzae]
MTSHSHVRSRRVLAAVAFVVMALAATEAIAQATTAPAGGDNCTGAPSSTGTGANPNHGSASLTERLDNCNGVLAPPATGDGGLVAPAPNAGETPVIKPGQLPSNTPSGASPG